MKSGSFTTCLFKQLWKDTFLTHEGLLFHVSVRWILKGNVLHHGFEAEG